MLAAADEAPPGRSRAGRRRARRGPGGSMRQSGGRAAAPSRWRPGSAVGAVSSCSSGAASAPGRRCRRVSAPRSNPDTAMRNRGAISLARTSGTICPGLQPPVARRAARTALEHLEQREVDVLVQRFVAADALVADRQRLLDAGQVDPDVQALEIRLLRGPGMALDGGCDLLEDALVVGGFGGVDTEGGRARWLHPQPAGGRQQRGTAATAMAAVGRPHADLPLLSVPERQRQLVVQFLAAREKFERAIGQQAGQRISLQQETARRCRWMNRVAHRGGRQLRCDRSLPGNSAPAACRRCAAWHGRRLRASGFRQHGGRRRLRRASPRRSRRATRRARTGPPRRRACAPASFPTAVISAIKVSRWGRCGRAASRPAGSGPAR